jgi:Tfp pilus assembly protein PilN
MKALMHTERGNAIPTMLLYIVVGIVLSVATYYMYTGASEKKKQQEDAAALASLRAKQAKKQADIDARPNVTIEFPKPSQLTR